MPKKNKTPFIKNWIATIDYGNGSGICYLFMQSSKVSAMSALSHIGIGEAAKSIKFVELGKTSYPNVFFFIGENIEINS